MQLHYLFGPVPGVFAEQNLCEQCRSGHCVVFNDSDSTGLTIRERDNWDQINDLLPAQQRPDFLVLYLPAPRIPGFLWQAPVPIIGLAPFWSMLWHSYRKRLACCDLVLCDPAGAEIMRQEGVQQARPMNLYGCERKFLEKNAARPARDIDILFIGQGPPAAERVHLPWLARLARLAERRRVVLTVAQTEESHLGLLRRARIVFNRALHGEATHLAFESACCGALLFQESGNRELPAYFCDRHECIYYSSDNLETLLAYYLEHEEERRAIAARAQSVAQRQCSFEHCWQECLNLIDREWPALLQHASRRPRRSRQDDIISTCWCASSASLADEQLLASLRQETSDAAAASATMHNALAMAVIASAASEGQGQIIPEEALAGFRLALERDPAHVVASLNLAEALAVGGADEAAREQAERTLPLLDREDPAGESWLDALTYPAGLEDFRVDWEEAAWAHAGQPKAEAAAKRRLLRWRLHTLLAEMTGDINHAYEAAVWRPDYAPARAALGRSLHAAGDTAAALAHLRAALAGNPFDPASAAALYQALETVGDQEGARQLIAERKLYARAAPDWVPLEDWFRKPPLDKSNLVSIIIPCCNEINYTRLCLESLLRNTREPYELILIDNASQDGTGAFFDDIRTRSGPCRVEIIRNAVNRGFPAACNQGIERSQGRYVVFLNNDIVLTPCWLDGLVEPARQTEQNIGLVGPVTNYAAPPQKIEPACRSPEELDAFAQRRHAEHAGRLLFMRRLTSFCLLVRRDVLDRIGGFDERFGLGFFDDDDLCLRACAAGFRLAVALSVYVHHFGSRTFRGLGIDCWQQLRDNLDRFREKWGAEHAGRYVLPKVPAGTGTPPSRVSGAPGPVGQRELLPSAISATIPAIGTSLVIAPSAGIKARVSLCMIVKDEEENMVDCLNGAAELVDEIIVVDTGSTDRTKELCARRGARVIDFAWVDDFSAARNESLRHARGEWIFWLDADDRLDEPNRKRLQALFSCLKNENAGYLMNCLCVADELTGDGAVVDHVRLFPNHPSLRWTYRVHEQIASSISRMGGVLHATDILIRHMGYQEPGMRHVKHLRNLRLLQMDHAANPDDPFTLFNLGWTHLELQQANEALPLLQRSLERLPQSDSIVRKLYALLSKTYRKLGRLPEALAICRRGRAQYLDDTELQFQEGHLLYATGALKEAEAVLAGLLDKPAPRYCAIGVDPGQRGYKARHNLAVVYRDQGRVTAAEEQWQAALREQPDYAGAWLGLAELYLVQERWDDVLQAARRLNAAPRGQLTSLLLLARLHVARGEFSQARRRLQEARQLDPKAPGVELVQAQLVAKESRERGRADADPPRADSVSS
jgi:GT2 family glycosyltransferase/Tfp pilus assembly protein PilF